MRGIHDGLIGWAKLPRFTPAHAGNTSSATYIKRSGWVHPRSRGEYIFDAGFGTFDLGSSPLTRGIREKAERLCPISGFIPAHAGNTLRVFSGGAYSRVHPRSRGEYRPPGTSKRPITGSPPLTRGIPTTALRGLGLNRFTPAHAGNTNATGEGDLTN